MPSKKIEYDRIVFTPEVIKEAVNTLVAALPLNEIRPRLEIFQIKLLSGENWECDNEDEFFADYRKGFTYAHFRKLYQKADLSIFIHLEGYGQQYTTVNVTIPNRADVEKIFSIFEANVEDCRLPKQPDEEPEAETDWITETINKIETYCPIAARKVRLALIKLTSEDVEDWQSAAMNTRDAWIELAQHLCTVKEVDTADIKADAVIDRLKRLGIEKTDEKVFDLARASFNLSMKHHARKIDKHTAIACVISTIVSMQTVIREVFSAKS
jgi:hypothetical protein